MHAHTFFTNVLAYLRRFIALKDANPGQAADTVRIVTDKEFADKLPHIDHQLLRKAAYVIIKSQDNRTPAVKRAEFLLSQVFTSLDITYASAVGFTSQVLALEGYEDKAINEAATWLFLDKTEGGRADVNSMNDAALTAFDGTYDPATDVHKREPYGFSDGELDLEHKADSYYHLCKRYTPKHKIRWALERLKTSFNVTEQQLAVVEGYLYAKYIWTPKAEALEAEKADPVNRPAHYISAGIESIDVIEAFGLSFQAGNAIKYILRAGRKDPAKHLEDLEKAVWYIKREAERVAKLQKIAE